MIISAHVGGTGTAGASRAASGSAEAGSSVPVDRVSVPAPLTAQELQLVISLRQRDREVRAHEAAHQAAGGSLAGSASFSFEQGPDGKSYAIGGEVSISLGGGRTASQRVAQARAVRAAALAPADPSGQDLRVAAEASTVEARASAELSEQLRLALRSTQVHGGASFAKAKASYSAAAVP